MIFKTLSVFIAALATTILCNAQNRFINAGGKQLSYQGRVIVAGDSAALSWTGTLVKIDFTGTEVSALLKDEHGENYLKVILDGRPLNDIHVDATKHLYKLVVGLANTKHTLQLFKRTEFIFGKTWFYGFDLGSNGLASSKQKTSKRAIEFYGNSITCGYGVLDSSGRDRGTPPFEDGYLSYAALTARHFGAQYSCIARSGIGLMVSWFPQIMPELYDRWDPSDSLSKWDFKNYKPKVVVVNLMQNDSWIIKLPDNEQFIKQFGDRSPNGEDIIAKYCTFIRNIRDKYPKATIICALGNMDISKSGSEWRGYLAIAIKELHDKKILNHMFAYKNTPGHPKVSEQQAMADDLINFIDHHVNW